MPMRRTSAPLRAFSTTTTPRPGRAFGVCDGNDDPAAVTADGNASAAVAGRLTGQAHSHEFTTRRRTPDCQHATGHHGHQSCPVGAEVERGGNLWALGVRVADQETLAAGRVADDHASLPRVHRGDTQSIRAEGDCGPTESVKGRNLPTVRRGTKLDGLPWRRDRDAVSVGAEREARPGGPVEFGEPYGFRVAKLLARYGITDQDLTILTDRGDPRSIATIGQVDDPCAAVGEANSASLRAHVPEPDQARFPTAAAGRD